MLEESSTPEEPQGGGRPRSAGELRAGARRAAAARGGEAGRASWGFLRSSSSNGRSASSGRRSLSMPAAPAGPAGTALADASAGILRSLAEARRIRAGAAESGRNHAPQCLPAAPTSSAPRSRSRSRGKARRTALRVRLLLKSARDPSAASTLRTGVMPKRSRRPSCALARCRARGRVPPLLREKPNRGPAKTRKPEVPMEKRKCTEGQHEQLAQSEKACGRHPGCSARRHRRRAAVGRGA